jgi:hypothetical protein
MKKAYIFLLLSVMSIFISCQKDIPLLGQDENGDTVIVPKSEVYIRAIILSSFPEKDPNTMLPWDEGSIQSFDSVDYTGPDIYYNFYKKSEEGHEMMYKQLSHFSNVLPLNVDSPLVYILTDPFQIFPEYIDSTFYLRIYDLDYADPTNDSTLIDSIPFSIGPDYGQTNPYISSKSGIGFNGSYVTLGLEWK